MRLHFLSHKFGRLALPWTILLVLVSTLLLPASHLRNFLLLDDLALAGLALVDIVVPKKFPLKRITSPARSFLTMNLAALLSIVVFFVPPSSLWGTASVKPEDRS
jgi:energy-coupling factor transporter transmembrane protein EcfT